MDWNLYDDYPPRLIRCLARKSINGSKRAIAVSDEEIAGLVGRPVEWLKSIYIQQSWDNITFAEFKDFLKGCNFDPANYADRNRAKSYIRQIGGAKFTYLRESPWWFSVFLPIINSMKENEK